MADPRRPYYDMATYFMGDYAIEFRHRHVILTCLRCRKCLRYPVTYHISVVIASAGAHLDTAHRAYAPHP